jgi:hypothetical protein
VIRVVEQHDVPARQIPRRPCCDLFRCRASFPVSSPARPQQRLPAQAPHQEQRRCAEHTVRRSIDAWFDAGRGCDHLRGSLEVGAQRARRSAEEQDVLMAMDRDLMSGSRNLGCKRRVALDLFANEEERRARTGAFELMQNRRCPVPVRAVVECDRDAG